jgi:hypothetical protein
MKECSKCNAKKSFNEFFKNKSNPDGYEYSCKVCRKKYVKETQKSVQQRYYENHKEERIFKNRVYELSQVEKTRENHKLYMRKRRQDPKWRLKESIMAIINFHLGKKSKSTIEYLGCSYEEYALYLENQFDKNMNWENYGKDKYWEIDHIQPLSKGGSFHYTNTRPCPINENRSKGNRWDYKSI